LGILSKPGCIPDVNQTRYLWEIYTLADPNYSGRVTVPVLWDKETATIVNNESREIIRMFDTQFDALEKMRTSIQKIYGRLLMRQLMLLPTD